jgi:hypothetical protein
MPFSDSAKFHLSWILPSVICAVVATLAALGGIEMIPLLILIVIGWVLSIALFFAISGSHRKRWLTITLVVSATIVFTGLGLRAYRYDRPIFNPQIRGMITRGSNYPGMSVLQVTVSNANSGRQSSFVKEWKLVLFVNGTTFTSRELRGESRAAGSVDLPEIAEAEFPPGKPVEGLLYFMFTSLSHTDLVRYFPCPIPAGNTDQVKVILSAVDSKTQKEWTTTKTREEFYREGDCAKTLGR